MADELSQGAIGGGEAEPRYGQGYRWEGGDAEGLAAALDAAFEYRGNVTLLTRGGGEVVGYLFNRDAEVEEPFVDVLPAAGGRRRIPYSEIRGVAFTGKDTAAGKSWETWLEKYNARKGAEARGEKVEPIDLVPEELD
jgi:hypothetical protein